MPFAQKGLGRIQEHDSHCVIMEWRTIPGYEGRYQVSDEGQVKSLARKVRCRGGFRSVSEILLKHVFDTDGYHMVSLANGTKGDQTLFKVHRLVLLAFVGPLPDGLESRHLDDDKNNNRLANLCYGTGLENWADRIRNGKGIEGLKNPNSKLTAEQVLELPSLWPEMTQAQIAEKYGLSEGYVQQLLRRYRNVLPINKNI